MMLYQWNILHSWNPALFVQQNPDSGILDISWLNDGRESGRPYDFIVRYHDNRIVYIEVKSTVSNDKACFEFSVGQVVFAQEKGDQFQLYRVYSAGSPLHVRLLRIDNVAHRLHTKQLRLFMAI